MNVTAKLAAFINQRNCMPFQWGKNDCCLLVADWVRFATGKDVAGLIFDFIEKKAQRTDQKQQRSAALV